MNLPREMPPEQSVSPAENLAEKPNRITPVDETSQTITPVPQNTSKLIVLLIFVLVISVLGVGGFMILSNSLTQPSTTIDYYEDNQVTNKEDTENTIRYGATITPVPILFEHSLFSEVEALFRSYQDSYEIEIKPLNYPRVWWVNNEGYTIANRQPSHFNMYLICSSKETDSYEECRKISEDLKSDLKPKVDLLMKKHGYSANINNTSSSLTDDKFYDYKLGFEKEKYKCVFIADPDGPLFIFSLSCTDQFEINEQEQLPYLKDLDLRDAVINVPRIAGDHGRMAVNYSRGGTVYYIKKVNGKWTKIYSAQEAMPCELALQYEVPPEIATNCY